MIALEDRGDHWHLSAPSHRALWQHLADGHGSELTTILAELDTTGGFFECAPVRAATADRPWAAVLRPTRVFDRMRADPRAFAAHLRGPGPEIRVFANLSGDCTLVCPTRSDALHLLGFLRTAPTALSDDLWATTAREVLARIDRTKPLWVSTHGTGVPWLHVRLDDTPKYYGHGPFRRADG
ncbi:MAG: hypothetical protein R3F61_04915 [Myxococcota bacterium]